MVSDASKKKAVQKKVVAAAKRGGRAVAVASKFATTSSNGADSLSIGVESLHISDRTYTGVLCSHPQSRDIRIESVPVTFHGYDPIVDSMLELNYGRRYGILGLNGCGKSTLLTAIGKRELPIPDTLDIYHLSREIEATDMTSHEAVAQNVVAAKLAARKMMDGIKEAHVAAHRRLLNSVTLTKS